MDAADADLRQLRDELDDVVREADLAARRAIEAGRPVSVSAASHALETAAWAVFRLMDARREPAALGEASRHARAQLATARVSLADAQERLLAPGELPAPGRRHR